MKTLFLSAIRPVMTYAAPAFTVLASECAKSVLRIRETKILRYIYRRPRRTRLSTLYQDAGVSPISEVLTELTRKRLDSWLFITAGLPNQLDFSIKSNPAGEKQLRWRIQLENSFQL